MRIGENLRAVRQQRGLRQYVVAEKAGVTKGMLSAYERGSQRPALATLLRLAQALEVSPAVLLADALPESLPRTTESYPLQLLTQNLRALRHERGLKQFVVAERAGITKAMLSAYETGRMVPALTTLSLVARALGVPPAQCFRDDPGAEPALPGDELLQRLHRVARLGPAAREELLGLLDDLLVRHEAPQG